MKKLIILPFILLSLQADNLKEFTKSADKAAYIYSPRDKSCQSVKDVFKAKTNKDALKKFLKITSNSKKKLVIVDTKRSIVITEGKFKNINFSFFPTKKECELSKLNI